MSAIGTEKPRQFSRGMAGNPFVACVILVPLILGILMTTAGIALMVSALGLIFLAPGLMLLAISFIASRQSSISVQLPEESTAIILYIALEFLAGAALSFIGAGNLVFGPGDTHWTLAAIVAFGLLLVSDSALLYRRNFRLIPGMERGSEFQSDSL